MNKNDWQRTFGNQLSQKQLELFFKNAAIELQNEYPLLAKLMELQEWEQAAQQAHKLKSLVRLLDIESILPYLLNIETKQTASKSAQFQADFQREYRHCLAKINLEIQSFS